MPDKFLSNKYSKPPANSTSKLPDIRSVADMMLESSLSGTVPVASSASVTRSSFTRKPVQKSSTSAPLSQWFANQRNPLISPTKKGSSISSPSDPRSGSVPDDSLSVISAAESKKRLQQMQLAVKQANEHEPLRNTTDLFRKACSTDLLFLVDTTGSMGPYIKAAKNQIKNIVRDIKAIFLDETEVRIAVVGYKDHGDSLYDERIQFLDFVSSPDDVSSFLDSLDAIGGADLPEDVLGGIDQAINASWKLQTRCLIHIGDAPPHGSILHDLGVYEDSYYEHGSEPHGFTYSPLVGKLVQLRVNYAFLRIQQFTDRMALKFSEVYAAAGADVRLLKSNAYFSEADVLRANASRKLAGGVANKRIAELQFEELSLGISFDSLRHLVVQTVSRSATLSATRITTSLSRGAGVISGGETTNNVTSPLASIDEDDDHVEVTTTAELEQAAPEWDTLSWFDEMLLLEGFCPDMGVHSASTLNDMMASDENIKLSVTQLKVYRHRTPFAEGAVRLACYARSAASTNRFVVKSFKPTRKSSMPHTVEDMRAQALCKAFALEFNSLLEAECTIDFIVTTGLQEKFAKASTPRHISLEPYIDGDYVKYNSNSGWVKEKDPADSFNDAAQAFSHFTFERSWGSFLVADIQGVGHDLTDPAIQTKDPDRFKLSPTNLGVEGFKFFFSTHECNSICHKLGLKSNKTMFAANDWEFREVWPTIASTVCCSNKLCRKIVHLTSAEKSDKYPGCYWCSTCWPQLQSNTVRRPCSEPGEEHSFDVSLFFYESQGQPIPRKCSEHLEKDTTAHSVAAVGGSLWSRMQATSSRKSTSGRAW